MNAPINPASSAHLPATVEEFAKPGVPMALAIWFDDRLFDRAKLIAKYISEAEGFAPTHLIGKPQACFAVVVRALTWKLDPYAVAMATYQTPGGRVGFEGKLCQAIIENSGKVEGGVKFEYFGDWSKVQGKFRIETSQKGTKYPVAAWKTEDEAGLGIIVRCRVAGETTDREFKMDLAQAFPRNSTLWATDPRTQLGYTAVRRFGSVAVPGLFMGVPFDREDMEGMHIGPDNAKDVTPPRPKPEDYAPAGQQAADAKAQAEPANHAAQQADHSAKPATTQDKAPPDQQQPAKGEADLADIPDSLKRNKPEEQKTDAPVAQLDEQPSSSRSDAGSSPAGGAKDKAQPEPWSFQPVRGKPVECSMEGFIGNIENGIDAAAPGDMLDKLMAFNKAALERLEKVNPDHYASIIDRAVDKDWKG